MCMDGHLIMKPLCKYIMLAKFSDSIGDQAVRLFDEEARKIVGITADELNDLPSHEQEARQQAVIENAVFRPFAVKVRSKAERYQEEDRINVVGLEAKPLSDLEDAKWMLSHVNRHISTLQQYH